MIHSLYIINQAGISIFSEYFAKSYVDEQLLSGFLTAIGSFSQEAIGGELQKLDIKTGEQMVLYFHEPSQLTIVAIANSKDYQPLLRYYLDKIINEFYKTYKKKLRTEGLFEDTTPFSKVCRGILAGKSAKRGKKELILGLFLGLILLGFLITLTMSWFSQFSRDFITSLDQVMDYSSRTTLFIALILGYDAANPLDPSNLFIYLTASLLSNIVYNKTNLVLGQFFNLSMASQLLLILSFLPSSFLGGYIAGSRKNGKWLGILFFVLALFFMLLYADESAMQLLLFFIGVYLPLILITSFIFGYFGGFVREMLTLYPLPPDRKLDSADGILIAERGILTTLTYIFAVFGVIILVVGFGTNPFFIFVGLILIILAIIFEIRERKKF